MQVSVSGSWSRPSGLPPTAAPPQITDHRSYAPDYYCPLLPHVWPGLSCLHAFDYEPSFFLSTCSFPWLTKVFPGLICPDAIPVLSVLVLLLHLMLNLSQSAQCLLVLPTTHIYWDTIDILHCISFRYILWWFNTLT